MKVSILEKYVLIISVLCLSQIAECAKEQNEIEENEETEGTENQNTETNKETKMEGKIVGGALTSSDQNPHAAYLAITCRKRGDKMQRFGCGSSIINQVILVTAAHCLENCIAGTFVAIGAGVEDKFSGLDNSAYNYVLHPKFNGETLDNDIALIRTRKRLRLGPKIKRIIIKKSPPNLKLAAVAGWGFVNEKEKVTTNFLKMTAQEILTLEECNKILSDVPKGTLCAKGTHEKGTFGYASKGDSGSGLVGPDFILRGIVSYKNMKKEPAVVVYTDVAYFYDWIKDTSRQIYCI